MDSYQHSWITFSLKMIRYEFFYSPSILSILMSSHTFPIFSSRSVVERRGGGEEPGRKGIQSFSIFSLLLYKKDKNSFTCANSKLQSCWSKTVLVLHYISNDYCSLTTVMYFYSMPTHYHLQLKQRTRQSQIRIDLQFTLALQTNCHYRHRNCLLQTRASPQGNA